ncbi:MAG: hypothetical protein RLN75_06460, partial [Longimicrobiales bacterium]
MRARITTLPLLIALAFAGLPDSSSTVDASAAATALSPSPAGPGTIDRAEISGFFCFFVYIDGDGAASGYSGESRLLTTPGGPSVYRCQADLLFGPGVDRARTFTRVPFGTF